jgi:hypothetical protein
VVFHTVAIAKKFIAMAKTTTGLNVTVDVLCGGGPADYFSVTPAQLFKMYRPLS